MKKQFYLIAILASLASPAQLTYNNQGLSTGTTSKSGVTAPAGYTWSELQNNTGNTTEANTLLGSGGTYSSSTTSYFIADDFIIPAGDQWNISSIDFFAYQTGYTGSSSPFNTVRVNIFKSDPSVSGAISVFGDDTTNRFNSSSEALMYRISNSSVPNTLIAPGTARKIWKIKANTSVTLGAGTYWIKYQLQNVVIANAGYLPPVAIPGSRGLTTFNAKQLDAITGAWTSIIDDGNPASSPDYPMDMPFIITYTKTMLGTTEVLQYDNRVRIYPNPAKDEFKINIPKEIQVKSIEILDTSGKLVKTLQQADSYRVADIPSGIYMVKIITNTETKITRLQVQK